MSEQTSGTKSINEILRDNNLYDRRTLAGSATEYRDRCPNGNVVFNANIFVLGEGKIWYGDIDITRDFDTLHNVAVQIGKALFILRELDGCFNNEKLSDLEIVKKAHARINP